MPEGKEVAERRRGSEYFRDLSTPTRRLHIRILDSLAAFSGGQRMFQRWLIIV